MKRKKKIAFNDFLVVLVVITICDGEEASIAVNIE